MNRTKIVWSLAIIGSSLMALVATASATTVTAPAGTPFTGTYQAASEGHVKFHNPVALIECGSAVDGHLSSHGAAVTASGPITSLSFTGCTGGWTYTVNSPGTLEVHRIAGTSNATLTSSGTTLTAFHHTLGFNCRYVTNNTTIGTITSAPSNTGHATLDVSAQIPFHNGSPFCGSGTTAWTGLYKFTTPTGLTFDD
jgi:hypothetical protein